MQWSRNEKKLGVPVGLMDFMLTNVMMPYFYQYS